MTTNRLSFRVNGMSCGHCAAAISTQLHNIPGVAEVDVDVAQSQVEVAGAELDPQIVATAIKEAGYEVAMA